MSDSTKNTIKEQIIFFIDPMSYNNLAEYDFKLLTNHIPSNFVLYFWGNKKYNLEPITTRDNLIFNYSAYSNKLLKTLSYIFSWIRVFYSSIIVKPDIIHIQWFKLPTFDHTLIKTLKRLLPKCKVVYTAHNILPHDTNDKFRHVFNKIYKTVDHIITHSDISKTELLNDFEINQHKISVIPHGLLSMEVKDERVAELKQKFQQKFNTNSKITFLIIGGISKYKGIDIFIDAWNNKKECFFDKSDCQLIIAGKAEKDLTFSLPKNGILIDKFLSNEEFVALIELSTIVVFPYRKISQSGALLTVLNRKKPVLVTRVGGLTDPFKFGEVGWIADLPEEKYLLKALTEIYNSKDKLKDIQKDVKMWDNIHTSYDWKSISKKNYTLYSKLV